MRKQGKVLLRLLEKMAFAPTSAMQGGGQMSMDPAAMQGAMPPMDPSMGAGMAAAGGQPMVDPSTGMPMDPSMMGGAPGGMPMYPSMMGGDPMLMPITELTVSDLIGLIGETVTQSLGGGEGAPAEKAPSEPKGEAEGTTASSNDIVDRLDQILALLGGVSAPAVPMGPEAGAVSPAGVGPAAPPGPAPKMAATIGRTSIADMILSKVRDL